MQMITRASTDLIWSLLKMRFAWVCVLRCTMPDAYNVGQNF